MAKRKKEIEDIEVVDPIVVADEPKRRIIKPKFLGKVIQPNFKTKGKSYKVGSFYDAVTSEALEYLINQGILEDPTKQ